MGELGPSGCSEMSRWTRRRCSARALLTVKVVPELDVGVEAEDGFQSDVRRLQPREAPELREDLLLTQRDSGAADAGERPQAGNAGPSSCQYHIATYLLHVQPHWQVAAVHLSQQVLVVGALLQGVLRRGRWRGGR